jgi:hypothetical protein
MWELKRKEVTVNKIWPTSGLKDAEYQITEERTRQVSKKGYTQMSDDTYVLSQLLFAARCYAASEENRKSQDGIPVFWPWSADSWKPTPDDRVKELVKAGALFRAEIERLERAEIDSNDIMIEYQNNLKLLDRLLNK